MATTLESHLLGRWDGCAASLVARGSTGLYALFRALRERDGDGEVVIPSICCDAVALAAIYAGLRPVIVDVDPGTACLTGATLGPALSAATRAVVLVYVLGHVVDPQPIATLVRQRGIVLVEDLCQAVGGAWDGRELGHWGDFLMLSFAADKILRGRGGALVQRVRDDDLSRRIAAVLGSLPPSPPERVIAQKSLSLRNLLHAIYDLCREDPRAPAAPAYRSLAPHYHDLFVRQGGVAEPEAVLVQLEGLAAIRERRYARYERYRREVRHPLVAVAAHPADAMVWRCSLRVAAPEQTYFLTRALRASGVHASNHYFPLGRLLYDQRDACADLLGSSLINLWVDDTVDEAQVDRAIAVVNAFEPA